MNNQSIDGPKSECVEGDGFSLRPFTIDTVSDRYIDWLNDPEVNQFLEVRFAPQNRQTATEFVESFADGIECYMWGIYPSDKAEPVGTVTLQKVDRNNGAAEFGIMVGDKEYWGKGAAAESIRLVARFSFDRLGLRRLAAGTYASNHGINFTLKQLGFTVEGKVRRAFVLNSGAIVDGYRWGILAEEWSGRDDGCGSE